LGRYFYTAAVLNLPQTAYETDFSCIGYILLEKDGQSRILYSGFDIDKNSRNIREIAKAALADPDADYSKYQSVLETFAFAEEVVGPLEQENAMDQKHDASGLR
jgi:hypothetical protein